MALQKITKRAVKGSLLIQFKFVENEGAWTHSSSSNSYAIINNKTLLITPQYPESIVEINCSFTLGDSSSADNSSDRYSSALFANGEMEYEQSGYNGLQPYGNEYSHSGGRNDRIAPTRRLGHSRNFRSAVGINHAHIPRSTNQITFDVRVKNNNTDRDFEVRDFFMIAKEIAISEDGVQSGSITFDGV